MSLLTAFVIRQREHERYLRLIEYERQSRQAIREFADTVRKRVLNKEFPSQGIDCPFPADPKTVGVFKP